jgi:hypothetical protein
MIYDCHLLLLLLLLDLRFVEIHKDELKNAVYPSC